MLNPKRPFLSFLTKQQSLHSLAPFRNKTTMLRPPPKSPQLSLMADKCTSMNQLSQIHAQMIVSSRIHDNFAASRLLSFCALSDSGDLSYALKLFHNATEPNSFMWNTLIRAQASSLNPRESVALYMEMRRVGVVPVQTSKSKLWHLKMDRNKKHIQPKTRNMASLSFHKVNMKVFSSFSNRMQPELLLLPIIFMAMVSADLQNPDFELPPSNLPENSTATFVLLDGNNTIPGWTFEGTVQYVTSGTTMSLPGNGHAIQLGLDGKINQTFIANADIMNYILTFTLAPGGQNCSSNADIIVSAPDSRAMFSVKQSYGMETWESYGHYLGSWGDEEPINLIIQSQTTESDANSTCWPIIDTLLLNKFGTLVQGKDNLLLNGGFELGPVFLSNSNQGILLDPEPSPVQSALQQWSVIGTVRYINSKHYFVPEGNAAIEIVSGISTGIQTAKTLTQGDSYHLEFSLGDANDSCVGDFIVGAQAGSTVQNITLQNKGTGSAKKFSMTFKADSSPTPISFLSYTSSQTKDGVFCGPVVDDVILHASNGMKLNPWGKNPVHILLLLAILLVIIEKY